MQGKHTARPNAQYLSNVALKVNQKLGGVNWELSGMVPFVSEDVTIVFGADVTHPAPGGGDRPSICAVVASMDQQATKYAVEVSLQSGHREIIGNYYAFNLTISMSTHILTGNLKEMIFRLFRSFYCATHLKPKRVVFFRDGVSEGMLVS
jgi:eukaryotic translation initiation factor 2C